MKNYTKFTAIFLVLAVALSVPALAASSGWYTQTITSDDWSYSAYYDHPEYSSGWYHQVEGSLQENTNRITFMLPSNSTGESSHPSTDMGFLFEANTGFSVSAGDVIEIESFDFTWFIGGADNYVSAVSIMFGTVLESYDPNNNSLYRIDNIVAASEWVYTGFTSGQAVQRFTFPDTTLKVDKGGQVDVVWLSFYLNHPVRAAFNIERVSFTFGYGNRNSAEAPNYTPPDEKPVDDYVDKEQELLDDTSEGMDIAEGIFNGFGDNLAGFVAGMMFVSNLMNLGITQIPAVGIIVQISLACGLFGVIVGLTGSILGAAERSHRNERRRR